MYGYGIQKNYGALIRKVVGTMRPDFRLAGNDIGDYIDFGSSPLKTKLNSLHHCEAAASKIQSAFCVGHPTSQTSLKNDKNMNKQVYMAEELNSIFRRNKIA